MRKLCTRCNRRVSIPAARDYCDDCKLSEMILKKNAPKKRVAKKSYDSRETCDDYEKGPCDKTPGRYKRKYGDKIYWLCFKHMLEMDGKPDKRKRNKQND